MLRRVLLCTAFAGTISVGADGQSPKPPSDSSQGEEYTIIVRISEELFEDLTRDVVEMSMPVRRTVDDFLVTGTATGKGETSVELKSSGDRAEIIVSVEGNCAGYLRSDVGPAVVRGTTRARFHASKTVHFDGMSFRDDPAATINLNCTSIDAVCAKRRGPVGKLIEHFGRRIGEKSLPEINQAAEDITRDMLTATFDEEAEGLIRRLNQTARFDDLLEKYFPETADWKYRLATRPAFLVAAVGPDLARIPDRLLDDSSPPQARMELWLRLSPGQAALLELIGELDLTYDLFQDQVGEDEAEKLADNVKLVRRDEWSVIQVGLPKPESTGGNGNISQPKQ